MIDTRLNLSPQALALLAALAEDNEQIFEDALTSQGHITTTALYNGRERGVCLSVETRPGATCRLLVFFAEDRKSDALFVQKSVSFKMWNDPPAIEDFSEISYKDRKHVPEYRIDLARQIILKAIENHLSNCHQCGSELNPDGWCGDETCEHAKPLKTPHSSKEA